MLAGVFFHQSRLLCVKPCRNKIDVAGYRLVNQLRFFLHQTGQAGTARIVSCRDETPALRPVRHGYMQSCAYHWRASRDKRQPILSRWVYSGSIPVHEPMGRRGERESCSREINLLRVNGVFLRQQHANHVLAGEQSRARVWRPRSGAKAGLNEDVPLFQHGGRNFSPKKIVSTGRRRV